jgi:hypothetical protein
MSNFKYIFILIAIFLLCNISAKATIYPIKLGTNYQSLYNLCPGDTIRFTGDSTNVNFYGWVQGFVYNRQTQASDNFNIGSYYNFQTSYDHILVAGDSSYYYQSMQPSFLVGGLYFNCITTGLQNNPSMQHYEIDIFPNPAQSIIHVESKGIGVKAEIQLLNSLGEIMLQQGITNSNISVNLQTLTDGIYFYRILIGEKIIKSDKLIILRQY